MLVGGGAVACVAAEEELDQDGGRCAGPKRGIATRVLVVARDDLQAAIAQAEGADHARLQLICEQDAFARAAGQNLSAGGRGRCGAVEVQLDRACHAETVDFGICSPNLTCARSAGDNAITIRRECADGLCQFPAPVKLGALVSHADSALRAGVMAHDECNFHRSLQ